MKPIYATTRQRALRRRGQLALFVFVGIVVAGVVGAVGKTTLNVASVDGDGWRAEGITVSLDITNPQVAGRVTVRKFIMAAPRQEIRDMSLDCATLRLSSTDMVCDSARLSAVLGDFGKQTLTGRGEWHSRNGALKVDLKGLKLGGGKADIALALENGRWRSTFDITQVSAAELSRLARSWVTSLPDLSADGKITLRGSASGAAVQCDALDISSTVESLTLNNASGTIATDKLTADVHAIAQRLKNVWSFTASAEARQGQGYVEPIFLDFGAHQLNAKAKGAYAADELRLDSFALSHRDVAQASGSARVVLSPAVSVETLRLSLAELRFPGAYKSYLQPLLLNTDYKSLTTSGSVKGELLIEKGLPQRLNLHLEALAADDGAQKFMLEGLGGDVHWIAEQPGVAGAAPSRSAPTVESSALSWRAAEILNLRFGAAALKFSSQGRQLRLLEPLRVPLFDGALRVDALRVRNAYTPDVAFSVDAAIEPISVRQIAHAFGWPEFGGSVGGEISKLRLRSGVMTVGSAVHAKVFGGELNLTDLRLEDPLGTWPRFHSSIAFENLDLALVTDAFSFGRITGRVSGQIANLELFNWTPVAFDARIATPPDDRSKHRISQRAVANIGNLGGGGAGVTAALSSGALRFFQDFNYDRLGITCVLKNEVCAMGGVAPASHGYYLVKGKGVPRIDVIATETRVDWPRVVQQLIAITESSGPVVR